MIEVLVAMGVAGMLLAGVGVVLHQVSWEITELRLADPEAAYYRALDLLAADARGVVQLEAVSAELSEHGRELAQFVTTNRLNAFCGDRWAGAARVSYWLTEKGRGGEELWRTEISPGARQADATVTCLMDSLAGLRLELHQQQEWRPWPEVREGDTTVSSDSIRVTAAASMDEDGRIRELPTAVVPIAVTAVEEAKR